MNHHGFLAPRTGSGPLQKAQFFPPIRKVVYTRHEAKENFDNIKGCLFTYASNAKPGANFGFIDSFGLK